MSAHSRLRVEAVGFHSWAADGAGAWSARQLIQLAAVARFAGPPARERTEICPVGQAVAVTQQRWPMEAQPGNSPRTPGLQPLPPSAVMRVPKNTCCKQGISSVVRHSPQKPTAFVDSSDRERSWELNSSAKEVNGDDRLFPSNAMALAFLW